MSEREADLAPGERRARDEVRGLARPGARAAFREELRREFVSGAIAGSPASWRPARGPIAWWALVPAAAALIVAIGLAFDRGPDWTPQAAGGGIAVIDGRPIPLSDRSSLERALRRGGSIRLAQGTLELVAPGHMAVEIASGSEVSIPPVGGRWLGRSMKASVRSGEIRLTTGRAFHGAHLAVATPEAEVEVVGTTLAVIRESVGTCVCVMEGRVMMGATGRAMAPIDSGRRRFVFNDGREPEEAEMRPVEKVALGELRARHAAQMR